MSIFHKMKKEKNKLVRSAETEISRFLGSLYMSSYNNADAIILEKVIFVHSKIRKNSAYKPLETLVPILSYIFLRLHDLLYKKSKLLSVSIIYLADKNNFIIQFIHYLSKNYE